MNREDKIELLKKVVSGSADKKQMQQAIELSTEKKRVYDISKLSDEDLRLLAYLQDKSEVKEQEN